MALSKIDQVRLAIGDSTEPYVLTDDQINHYLTINSDSVDAAISDLSPIMQKILAVRANSIRTEDLWLDNRDMAKRYKDSISTARSLKAASAYPIIGGCDTYRGNTLDQFDDENNWESEDSFYNGYEDI